MNYIKTFINYLKELDSPSPPIKKPGLGAKLKPKLKKLGSLPVRAVKRVGKDLMDPNQ